MMYKYGDRFLAVHCQLLPQTDDSHISFRDLYFARKQKSRPSWLDRLQLDAARSHSVSGRERLAKPIEAKHGEAAAVHSRAERADRFLTCAHRSAGLRCEALESYGDHAGSGDPAMLHARNHLLADEAALGKIDPTELVHVGLVRKRIAIAEIEPAARDCERSAMRLVRGRIGQLRANPGCRFADAMGGA